MSLRIYVPVEIFCPASSNFGIFRSSDWITERKIQYRGRSYYKRAKYYYTRVLASAYVRISRELPWNKRDVERFVTLIEEIEFKIPNLCCIFADAYD